MPSRAMRTTHPRRRRRPRAAPLLAVALCAPIPRVPAPRWAASSPAQPRSCVRSRRDYIFEGCAGRNVLWSVRVEMDAVRHT